MLYLIISYYLVSVLNIKQKICEIVGILINNKLVSKCTYDFFMLSKSIFYMCFCIQCR